MQDRRGRLLIGALAERAGVSVQSIRHYERKGLLVEPLRSESGYRLYASEEVETVRFIKRCQALGWSLAEVGSLLHLKNQGAGSCAAVRRLAAAQLGKIRQQNQLLWRIQTALTKLARDCEDTAPDGPCPVLQLLEGELSY